MWIMIKQRPIEGIYLYQQRMNACLQELISR